MWVNLIKGCGVISDVWGDFRDTGGFSEVGDFRDTGGFSEVGDFRDTGHIRYMGS